MADHKDCPIAFDNEYTANMRSLRKELGADGFNRWFEKHLEAVEDLKEAGFVAAICLEGRLRSCYDWIMYYDGDGEK